MSERTGQSAVILLVEDDPADQELTRRALGKGKLVNQLMIVEDGESALDYLLRRGEFADPAASPAPDLILLDLNLPKVSGREVLQELRNAKEFRTPVVVLTTSAEQEDVIRSYDLGVHSYITKPVDMAQFVKVIQTLEQYWFEVVVRPPRSSGA